MNQIATLAPMPTITRALSAAIASERESIRFGPPETPEERLARIRRNDPAPGMVIRLPPPRPTVGIVEEAKRILPQLVAAMQPPPPATQLAAALRMLEKVNASVASPLGKDALRMRACFLAEAGSELPAAAWDVSVDRKILRAFKFMPSVAEIIGTLEAETQSLRDKVARVRFLAEHVFPDPQKVEKPTPEEIERRQAHLAEMRAASEAQDREDAEVREFGMWMPPGAEGKTGRELASCLREHLPGLDDPKLRITERRIETLELAASMADQLAILGEGIK